MRFLAVVFCAVALAVPATVTGARPVAAEPVPGTTCALFPSDNVLNTDVSSLPVSSMSATWKSNMAQNAYLHPDLGTVAQQYGIPINVAPPPTTGVAPTFTYDSESDHPAGGYPIDQSTLIEGGPSAPSGSDRHALVVDASNCNLYELYNLQNFTNGQAPAAGSGAVWNLGSNAMRPDGWTSADAAGLPIAPLLLRPDEILAGSIAHAIRMTTHCTYGYIWPASHNAGLCSAGYPPMGARFRLRSSFDASGFGANTQVVLRAFQHYGLVVADNGSDWYFQGTTDDWWGTAAGSQVVADLKTIPSSAFDAVDESGIQATAGSYQALPPAPPSSLAGAPAAASGALNQLYLGGAGRDRQVWYLTGDGTTWGSWAPEGGIATSDPAAASWGTGRLDLFVRGADGALWHRALSGGSWASWEGLGGSLIGGPGATTWGAGRIDVFVTGVDHAVWHRAWNGSGWTAWESLGGYATSDPAASTTGTSELDVFVRGSDRALWRRSWNGTQWSAWQSLGGVLAAGPAAASQGSSSIDVFAAGVDGALWHLAWNGAKWSAWQTLGGSLTSSPTASSWGAGRLDVYARGTDLEAWHRAWNGTAWSAWSRVLGPPAG